MFHVTLIENGLEIDVLGGIPFLRNIVRVSGRAIGWILGARSPQEFKVELCQFKRPLGMSMI